MGEGVGWGGTRRTSSPPLGRRASPRGILTPTKSPSSSKSRNMTIICWVIVAVVVLFNTLPGTSIFYQDLPPPHVVYPPGMDDPAVTKGHARSAVARIRDHVAKAIQAPPPPEEPAKPAFGACPEIVTPFSVDCHILQSKRQDPYNLRWQAKAGMLPDVELDKCDDIPGLEWGRKMLNNMEVADYKDEEKPREGMRVMCMILTYSGRHDNNLEAVRSTWGKHCHGFVAFSNLTDPMISAVATPVFGGERYSNTWQKMRSLWKYTWFHYSNEFDWFLKADDDAFIIWENLMEYLGSKEVQAEREAGKGVLLGRRFAMTGNKADNYTSGGAGYALDRVALGALVQNLDTKGCDPNGQHQFEDYWAGKCLRQGGVAPMDTRDELGRQRFNPFQPWNHYQYKEGTQDWYAKYSLEPLKYQLEAVSRKGVSFHYQPRKEMLQTNRYLYNCRHKLKANITNL